MHIINVSKIGPSIATRPCLTGSDVLAEPCTSVSVPIPASFECAPLLTPIIITAITLPPATAEPVKASSIIILNAGMIESKFNINAINTEPKYNKLIEGTNHSETLAILINPPRIIAPVTPAKTIPAIKLKLSN